MPDQSKCRCGCENRSNKREAGNSSRKVFRAIVKLVFTVFTEIFNSSAISLYFLHSIKLSFITCEQRSGRSSMRARMRSNNSSRVESSDSV